MFKHFLTNSIVVRNEPQLTDYLRSNETDYNDIIEEAEEELLTDLVNMNYDLTRMCKKLELCDEEDICGGGELYTGSWSSIDYARRLRLFISISGMGETDENNTYSITIVIKGTNNEDGIPTNDEIFTILTKTYGTEPADGEYSYVLPTMFRRYRIYVTAISNNDDPIELNSYLIENIYTELMKLKVRAKIYLSLKKSEFDEWHSKFVYYAEEYAKLLKSGNYYVDADDSGQIDEGENESPTDNIIMTV